MTDHLVPADHGAFIFVLPANADMRLRISGSSSRR